jgi:hypothetical protein
MSIGDFQLLDLFDQQEAVKTMLAGQSPEAQLNWLRSQGNVHLVPREFPGGGIPQTYVFESRIGLRCAFWFKGDEMIAGMKT